MSHMALDADRQSQFLRGSLDMCLLALLQEQPSHAYELATRLERRGLEGVGYGTLYPLVTRLRRLGLLDEEVQASASGPPRKVFTPSAAGRQALTTWAERWWSSTSVVLDLLRDTGVLPTPGAENRPVSSPRELR